MSICLKQGISLIHLNRKSSLLSSSVNVYSFKKFSSFNFRKNLNEFKQNAQKMILIENVSNQRDLNQQFKNGNNFDKEYLSDKLNVPIDRFWTWSYRRRNFLLAELNSLKDVETIQNNAGFSLDALPVRTRMVEASLSLPSSDSSEVNPNQMKHHEFETLDFKKFIFCSELRNKFASPELLIKHISDMNSLTELDLQLRYFLLTQLEELLCRGVFSGFQVYPFGSSLAGLGDATSDLDIVLLHTNLNQSTNVNFSRPEIKSDRDQTQQSLSLIADIMRHFAPNFSQINRILRARVPIVKMRFDLAPIEIDISVELSEETGHHGFIMANYLSYCIGVDPNVKHFFTFLKHWAKQHGLVRSIAGNWFSNFQIITLAIYFLQSKNIVKSINSYETTDSQHDCRKPGNCVRLLYDFYEFLISFNFDKEAISILSAQTFPKPDFSPIYIENPIERNLNICKNVNGIEFKKLLLVAYNSMDAMHSDQFSPADLLDPEYFKKLEAQSSN